MNVTALNTSTASAPAYTKPAPAAQATDSSVGWVAGAKDLNSSTMVTLTYASTDSAEYKALYDQVLTTRTGPSLTADDSIKTIEDRLGKFQKTLSLSHPDLAESGWDITVKDGKIKVTGDMSADDKRHMEARLNSDQALVGAVQSYMSAAQRYLETDGLNPPYTAENGFTGKVSLYNFEDVGKQLEGTISFRELIATSWSAYDNPYGGEATDPGSYRGNTSLEILASRLTSTPLIAD